MQRIFDSAHKLPLIPSSDRYNITISHQKRFLWFRVAKVGTTTIFHQLQESGVDLDVERASNVYYSKKIFKDYFKFAFVRNPWERLVSCWQDKVVKKNMYRFEPAELIKMRDFRNFVDFVEQLDIEKCDRHICLQSALIDLSEIDYLGRMEAFEKDLIEIFGILDVPLEDVKKKNKSSYENPFRELYTQELIERVAAIYRKDIQIFGYHFNAI